MGGQVQIVFRPDPKDVPEIMRRTYLTIGQPFIEIPMDRRPDEHKVLAEIDGHKVRRADVEMVFNDTVCMNFAYALTGRQCEDDHPPDSAMAQVRALARKLYGTYGEWIEANYGTVCLECNLKLPEHTPNCSAGLKHKASEERAHRPPIIDRGNG